LSDIGLAEIPVDEDEHPLPPPEAPAKNALLDGPILPTLLWLAWPNIMAFSAATCVVIAETSYIGRLGVESLAAIALVFPCVMLTMTMSGGAMGGGVASAIARAIGAGDKDRASTLASHALLIGICFGLVFMLGMLIFGRGLLGLLGGRGNVLEQAVAYMHIFFGGAVLPWLMQTMAGVLRGTGNMKLPSMLMFSSAVCQIVLGGTLGLGLGPIPAFGMRGVAAGSLTAYFISVAVMSWYLFSGRARVVPKIRGLRIQWSMLFDILKGRRGVLLLAATVGADHQHLHPYAGGLRHRDSRRLRHRRAARISADVGVVLVRYSFGADDRHGGRRPSDRAGAADRLDRGHGFVRRGRRDCDPDRDLSGYLGQHLHQRCRRDRRQPAISRHRGADVRLHRFGVVDVFFLARRGQGAGAGAGADRAAGVHQRRRLVALDPQCVGGEFLRARGGIDGRARRTVLRERDPDKMGTEGRPCSGSATGADLNDESRMIVIPGRCEASVPESRDSPVRNCATEVWCQRTIPE
jgi:hypothetical protein